MSSGASFLLLKSSEHQVMAFRSSTRATSFENIQDTLECEL